METADSGRCVYPSAELDIHVVRRRERLATETTEETDTPVPALCSIRHTCIITHYRLDSVWFLVHRNNQQVGRYVMCTQDK